MSETNSRDGESGTRQILVMTDKKEDVRFIKKSTAAENFRIRKADNCEDAYDIIKKHKVDLMLIDLECAGGETGKFCSLLHGGAETAPIPVIAITSPGDNRENGKATLDTGADDFLSRPLQTPALLVRIRMLLRLKDLHEDISRRNVELEAVNQELASRNKELELGLEMAHRLQRTLLPRKYPMVRNVSFHHIYMPADAIGGDIFQIAPMSGERAVVFLSDVSGHGIRAALVTSILKTVFEHVYFEDKNAAEILRDVNSRFLNVMGPLSPHIYATAFVMVVDGENRCISTSSAGHVCPFLISKRRMSCTSVISPDNVGPALGFFQNPQYMHEEKKLEKNDIVLGVTDGIFEVTNDREEIYGLDRLHKLIEKNIHLVPRDIIERILRETDTFRKHRKRPDDICMVAVEVH